MAMIKCPDCKNPVSDSAEACPRCGCKFRYEYNEMLRLRREIPAIEGMTTTEGESAWSGGLIVAAVVGLFLAIFGLSLLNSPGRELPGLLCLVGGGFLCWFGCAFQYDKLEQASIRKSNHNANVREQKANLAQKKSRLAYLEAKFR